MMHYQIPNVGAVYTARYNEDQSCENHDWSECWKKCKCFYCDSNSICLDRDYIDKCNGDKTINDHCEKDSSDMIIAWSIFDTVIFVILALLCLCMRICIYDTRCCKTNGSFDNSNQEEINCQFDYFACCYPKAEIIVPTAIQENEISNDDVIVNEEL